MALPFASYAGSLSRSVQMVPYRQGLPLVKDVLLPEDNRSTRSRLNVVFDLFWKSCVDCFTGQRVLGFFEQRRILRMEKANPS